MKKIQPQNQNQNCSTLNYSLKIIFEQIITTSILVLIFLPNSLLSFGTEPDNSSPKWLTDKYEVSEPVSLIPQKNLEGWTTYNGKEPAKGKWKNENGKLVCAGSKNNHLNGDIVSKKEYENFILDFVWIISKGGNSGIKYKLKDFGKIGAKINQNDSFSWLGCEYQILDDDNNREGKSNNNKNSAASLYSTIAPNKNKKLNPHEQPNSGKIIVAGEHIEHWLNGEKVLEYNLNSDDWKNAHKKSKYARAEDFAKNKTGFIMLQDHGNKIIFTKLTIRELKTKK
ncbi:MAG: DUF1080 domain-containing protein [Planctomycetaceae bacterium]|jgi:hypothetical protein|nr:DUF1080 domain-containing protein [Planctomycetaceae bacterium]